MPGGDEGDVLEHVDRLLPDRGVEEQRDVPADEQRERDRERDAGMRDPPQGSRGEHGEHRPQQRAGQPREQERRCEVDEQEVLRHVRDEEVAFCEVRERRQERDAEHPDARRETGHAHGGHRSVSARERPGASAVGA